MSKKLIKKNELTDEEVGRLFYLAISSKSTSGVRKRAYELLNTWYQILKLTKSEKRKLTPEKRNWYLILSGIASLRLHEHGVKLTNEHLP